MKRFYRISTWLFVFLGCVHTLLTPAFYPSLTLDALWFAGAGLACVFLGLLNAARGATERAFIARLTWTANTAGAVYFILIILKLNQPQAWICLLLLACMFFGSIATGKAVE